jgi:hypothetical protein
LRDVLKEFEDEDDEGSINPVPVLKMELRRGEPCAASR